MGDKAFPLVTVGVYTYNSSKTVLETLESIKSQAYPRLELIVADDCSTDKTVPICKKWISRNKDRFVNTQIIIPEKNTGQSGNYNRALKASHGEWIKDIDGDDLLTPNCIEDYVNFVKEHPEAIFVFGKAEVFGTSKQAIDKFNKVFDYHFFDLPVQEKYERLITKGNCIASPSAFSNVLQRKEMGLFYDERIPLLEDLPMWVRATKIGIDLFFLDKVVCQYRVGGNGVTSGKGHIKYGLSVRLYYLYYIFPELYERNPKEALNKLAERDTQLYISCKCSKEYRLGQTIIHPLQYVKRQILRLFRNK